MNGKIALTVTTLISLLMFCSAALLHAGGGDLDPTFSGDGRVTTQIGDNAFADAIVVQVDGKIIAAGNTNTDGNNDFALARYNPNGSLDNTFDNDGKLITNFGGTSDRAHSLALQSDGKIIAVGETNSDGTLDFALARYNSDGSLDGTFDTDGLVTTDLGGTNDVAYGVALQTDGKIIVAGCSNSTHSNNNFAVVRYNADGSLDTSFDGDGVVITDFQGMDDHAYAVAVQPMVKIIVAGDSSGDFALARYNGDGSLDSSFGEGGRVTTNVRAADSAEAIAIQMDEKIIVAGVAGSDFGLARYNPDGSLDSNFNGDGIVTTDFDGTDHAYAVSIQTDGKIIAAGNGQPSGWDAPAFALACYNQDGSLDSDFGGDGKVTTAFVGLAGSANANAVSIQADGKIVAAGWTDDYWFNDYFALARYLTAVNNTIPVAVDDTFSTPINTPLNVPPPGVLGNDSDADGDPLTAALNSDPLNGTLMLNSDGSFSYTPNSGFTGSDSFTYLANDGLANSNVATVTINVACLYCDDFADGVLSPDWIYIKNNSFWSESGGNLIGTNFSKTSTAFVDPRFPCSACYVKTVMSTAGGKFNRISFFFLAQDVKSSMVELVMKEDADRWVLKQRINKRVVAKAKAIQLIDPNVFYTVQMRFDGTNFVVSIDGVDAITMAAGGLVTNGSVGFKVTRTIGSFQYIEVNL